MHDRLNLSMFRAYDIRTPAEQLTAELATRLADAEAFYFREVLGVEAVVVAHDARLSGPGYLSLSAAAYCQAGLDVYIVPGPCSASQLYFTAMRHPECAAVLFGASHNPGGDTGQKLLAPALAPVAERIGPAGGLDKVREFYVAGLRLNSPRRGRLVAVDYMADYISHSMHLAGVKHKSLAKAAVLHDYVNGAAGKEMMLAFQQAGAELTALHYTADGRFPLGAPNPVKQDVIREGLETLRSGRFLLGTFFDGDGDRIDFYDGSAQYLSSSFVYAAILPEIRRRFTGGRWGVFADLKCNPLAIIEMAKAGVTVDVIRNGHSQIKQSLIDDVHRFGAVEESAHYYEAFAGDGEARYCTENTLYMALLAARVWREQPERIRELLTIQASTARQREWGYRFPSDAARAEALAAVRESLTADGAATMERMKNGMDLEATLMRRGLPFDVNESTRLAEDWLQVSQRVSQSENGLARWEVVGARPCLVAETKAQIAATVARFGAGEEYQG